MVEIEFCPECFDLECEDPEACDAAALAHNEEDD